MTGFPEGGDFEVTGRLADWRQQRIRPVRLVVRDGHIAHIEDVTDGPQLYIAPGFVDAHVHIESSMLTPGQFARLAVVHGTVGTVSDPHEIGNVLGVAGVRYMLENGAGVPFHFAFGAPSCVPATGFETAGAEIGVQEVAELLQLPGIRYLAEMMDYPGVLHQDPVVVAKIAAARRLGKPVDGHAPGLRGAMAAQYAAAGISTDHECFTADEARDKLAAGMHILIREGSAAKNFDALIGLLAEYPDRIMFCSDDKHPDSLVAGHINDLARRAVARGHDVFAVLRAACVNPVRHYGLPVGLLRPGDPADFILLHDLRDFRVAATYVRGRCVARNGQTLIESRPGPLPNRFGAAPTTPAQYAVPSQGQPLAVIEAIDGQLITHRMELPPTVLHGFAVADPARDLLKLTVVNRYADAPPAVAFIRNFGLKTGALASSVAHDSHNIIAVGTGDEVLCRAVNAVIAAKGGLAVAAGSETQVLPLPIAGLMTDDNGYEVARRYEHLDRMARALGSPLQSPFMTLSFMALLVIPSLKLSDRGLFDGDAFTFVSPH